MPKVPYRALSLMGRTAVAIGRHGVTKGIAKTVARVSGPLLVLEAATSVAGAIGSYIDLQSARIERDGLRATNASLAKTLALQREALAGAIENARSLLQQERALREALAKVVALCRDAFSNAMQLCAEELQRELPDFAAVEQNQERLEQAWADLKSALLAYQDA